MMQIRGTDMAAGETAYLRVKVLGFDVDYDGTPKAVCALMDAQGNYDESEQWFFREKQLARAGVLAADLEAKAKAMAEKMRGTV